MRTSSGHPRREVLAGSALAAALAIALAACSPSPQPAAFPTASAGSADVSPSRSSPNSTPSPLAVGVPSPPTTRHRAGRQVTVIDPPGGMTRESRLALKVVQEYFGAQISRPSIQSVSTMRRLVDPACSRCKSDISVLSARATKGQYTVREDRDPSWGSTVYSFRDSTGPGLVTVRLSYLQPPLRLLENSGATVGETRSAKTYTSLFVVRSNGARIVSRTPVT